MKNIREQQTMSVIKFAFKTISKRSSELYVCAVFAKTLFFSAKLTSHSRHFPVIVIFVIETTNFQSATRQFFHTFFY